MATTVPPGNHYKVRIRTMQAASSAALASGSSSTKQGRPPHKAPCNALQRHPSKSTNKRSIVVIALFKAT